MRTLLVDNHDSYTFNLFQLLAEVNGIEPVVVGNDDPALLGSRADTFDAIVISPGPGRPQHPRDVGHLPVLLGRTTRPVLGVCLGHQLIAHLAGARVEPAPAPRHGHLTTVRHTGGDLFAGLPAEFTAVRYHSLCVAEPLPDTLIATAWAEDGVLMALRHRDLARWGVQFHPESIASEYGRRILTNFRDLAGGRRARRMSGAGARTGRTPHPATTNAVGPLRLASTSLPWEVDTEAIYRELFAASPNHFWLDGAMVHTGQSRFSFLGDDSGPLGETLTYRVGSGSVIVRDARGTRTEPGNAFEVLSHRLRARRIPNPGLPFDLTGGYVGYFGYEMKADCGQPGRHRAETPDAAWIFADRLVAVDHRDGLTHLLALHENTPTGRRHARAWLGRTARRLAELGRPDPADRLGWPSAGSGEAAGRIEDHLVRREDDYLADIAACRRELIRGESYEVCLTNRLRLPIDGPDPAHDLAFYQRLRRANPAPYAALLRIGDLTVFGSSPERFLRIRPDGEVESRPIKGTAPRDPDPRRDAEFAAALAADPKTRAENLMIVDLLRNDLGRVCEIGSVRVPEYLAVESYATVHQLVSSVRGRLRPGVGPVECVRSCFPGGSMTGAPKARTMEIIDRLETEARGVYSGALGYFGLSGGADLSIVIRTVVRHGDELTVGAGGAIVLGSDPRQEYAEMLLKAAAPMRACRAPSRLAVSMAENG